MNNKNDDKKRQEDKLKSAIQIGLSAERVSRFGDAGKEYFVAYSGKDNATGQTMSRGLKQISDSKVNKAYEYQNIKQQAGFSAEVMSVHDKNAENIINGNGERWCRSEDFPDPQKYGKNNQIVDTVCTDKFGNIIPGTEIQVKFVGNSPEGAFEKLMSKDYQKYFDAEVKLEVPSDYYQGILNEADQNITSLKKQLANPHVSSDPQKRANIENKLKKCEQLKKNLRQSTLSNKDAIFARENPKLATALKINSVAHKAGIQGAKDGAMYGGACSLIKNMVALVNDDIKTSEAVKNVVKDTGKAATIGYANNYAGTVLSAFCKNASNSTLRAVGNSALPAATPLMLGSAGKNIYRYIKNEISGNECAQEIFSDGFAMLSSACASSIANTMITTVAGGAIAGGSVIAVASAATGALIGYMLTSATISTLKSARNNAKLAYEERERIERECAEQIEMLKQYRAELEHMIQKHLSSMRKTFSSSISQMKEALVLGDVDGYIGGTNQIVKALNGNVLFENYNEFNELMLSDRVIKI